MAAQGSIKIIIMCVCVYLAVMNIAGFTSMAADKIKAKKKKRRISEAALLLTAGLGGSFGAFLAMNTLRHKTKHVKFVLAVPLFLIAHILLLAFLIWRFVL